MLTHGMGSTPPPPLICRDNDGVIGTESSPYAVIVTNVGLKRHFSLALLILDMKIGLSSPIANHA